MEHFSRVEMELTQYHFLPHKCSSPDVSGEKSKVNSKLSLGNLYTL